ncbi:MAG: DoxX family membrane protein [Bacteroidetes bacterium]|nr:DoxX family membrane protein [Bacteroidota bacterium]
MNRLIRRIFHISLGTFFLLSGLFKGADVGSFAAVISEFDLTPHGWSLAVAVSITGIEIVCGMMMMLGISPRRNAVVLFCLVGVFTIAIVSALLRGIDIACGCFGAASSGGIIDRWTMLRNILLLVLLAITARGPRDPQQQQCGPFGP